MAGEGVSTIGSDRVAQVTIAKWAKKVSEQTTQRYLLLKMMQEKGRVQGCDGGGEYRWPVRYRDVPITGFIDMDPVEVTRESTKTNAVLGWRSYRTGDFISRRERLENAGEAAMVKIFASREEDIRRMAIRQLAGEFFKDGNRAAATADGKDEWHGIESFMSIGAQTNTDELATSHDDTYAGLSTAVAGLDADSTRVWTPVIVNCNRVVGGSTRAWADYGDEYLRTGFLEAAYGQGAEDNIDVALLTKSAFKDLLNILDDKERVPISRGAGMGSAGFGVETVGAIELDGVKIMWDAGVPLGDGATTYGGSETGSANGSTVYGYGFNTNRMKLLLLGGGSGKQIWQSEVNYNATYKGHEIFLYLVGNLVFESPRHFVKFAAIS